MMRVPFIGTLETGRIGAVDTLLEAPSSRSLWSLAAAGEIGRLLPQANLDPHFGTLRIAGDPETRRATPWLVRGGSALAFRGEIDVGEGSGIPENLGGVELFADPPIATSAVCMGDPASGSASSVAGLLHSTVLAGRGLTGRNVAIAIMDDGIDHGHLLGKLSKADLDVANSWVPVGAAAAPGAFPAAHGTMSAFDALIAAPDATLLDFAILPASLTGGAPFAGTISTALLAYAQLLASWASLFSGSGLSKYRGLVVNNSWQMYSQAWDFPAGHPGRYCDNPRHPFHRVAASLAGAGADILFCAGNCGSSCPDYRCGGVTSGTIMGANASADVLTVAACDDADALAGYSSEGPSIAGMPPEKPDVTAYTHFVGSEVGGAGKPDDGTSAACAVAAGCVAALRSSSRSDPRGALPPATLFGELRSHARQPTPHRTGWHSDFGFGIIDPLAVASALGL
jgi:hypothetical protein